MRLGHDVIRANERNTTVTRHRASTWPNASKGASMAGRLITMACGVGLARLPAAVPAVGQVRIALARAGPAHAVPAGPARAGAGVGVCSHGRTVASDRFKRRPIGYVRPLALVARYPTLGHAPVPAVRRNGRRSRRRTRETPLLQPVSLHVDLQAIRRRRYIRRTPLQRAQEVTSLDVFSSTGLRSVWAAPLSPSSSSQVESKVGKIRRCATKTIPTTNNSKLTTMA